VLNSERERASERAAKTLLLANHARARRKRNSVNSYLQPFKELNDKRQWLRKEASISAAHADYRPGHGLV
jgi:hypothetical protein